MIFSLLVVCSCIRSLNGVFTLRLRVFTIIDCSFNITFTVFVVSASIFCFHELLFLYLTCACLQLALYLCISSSSKACTFRQLHDHAHLQESNCNTAFGAGELRIHSMASCPLSSEDIQFPLELALQAAPPN